MRKLTATIAAAAALTFTGTTAAYTYPPVARATFISTCLQNGPPEASCACAFRYMAARESYRTFVRQALIYERGGRIPVLVRRAAYACGLSVL